MLPSFLGEPDTLLGCIVQRLRSIIRQRQHKPSPQFAEPQKEKSVTPAVNAAKKARIPYTLHTYTHDPAAASYGSEAAEKLGVEPARVFKTLVAELDAKRFAVAVIPVSDMLSLKRLAEAAGAKKAKMADGADVERISGYVLGGVSPLGQKRRLTTFIDASAQDFPTIYVSAGRRGVELELSSSDLQRLLSAVFVPLAQKE